MKSKKIDWEHKVNAIIECCMNAGADELIIELLEEFKEQARQEVITDIKSGKMCMCDCCGEFKEHSMLGTCVDCI